MPLNHEKQYNEQNEIHEIMYCYSSQKGEKVHGRALDFENSIK